MDMMTIGWIWLGILIGVLLGFIVCAVLTQSRISELESDLAHLKFVRDSLKEEIFRLDNRVKPKPRKRRKKA